MSNLLLTLGHGSSAVLVQDNKVLCGYEEERLSLVKSDSRFPANAISECLKHNKDTIDGIYVSHWFPFGELPNNPNKYWNPYWILDNVPGLPDVYSVNRDFTHHDCHAMSAMLFSGDSMPVKDTIIIVADGFGNFGECLSVYQPNSYREPRLVQRCFGYNHSLGMMYQYATAYLGMKENQDEYKLLGYETTLYDFPTALFTYIYELAYQHGVKHYKDMTNHVIGNPYDPMYNVSALPALRVEYGIFFDRLLSDLKIDPRTADKSMIKAIISYYVQKRLETVLSLVVENSKAKNLILVGGVFMNVKLNKTLSNMVDKICIMPLAGDQGAALGLYKAMNPEITWPDHLYWGLRDLSIKGNLPLRMYRSSEMNDAGVFISNSLLNDYIVNVIRGPMEFGSRALCHTSTLALPTKANVEYINKVNDRDTIMPMAPVITPEAVDMFIGHEKVVKSLDYMITALDYRNGSKFSGAANYYPENRAYTGRPQITREVFMKDILGRMPDNILINTSMNEHGMPICYSVGDAIRCHQSQIELDSSNKIITVVCDE